MNSAKYISHPCIYYIVFRVKLILRETIVVKTDLTSYKTLLHVYLIFNFIKFHSLKFNLRASNFQNIPGSNPTPPYKIGMLCASILCLFHI